jgi:hypothetical protein
MLAVYRSAAVSAACGTPKGMTPPSKLPDLSAETRLAVPQLAPHGWWRRDSGDAGGAGGSGGGEAGSTPGGIGDGFTDGGDAGNVGGAGGSGCGKDGGGSLDGGVAGQDGGERRNSPSGF